MFLSGLERIYLLSVDKKYYQYIKDWFDHYIDADGNICFLKYSRRFDNMQPAIMLFNLYKETKDERYKKVLDNFSMYTYAIAKAIRKGFLHKSFTGYIHSITTPA